MYRYFPPFLADAGNQPCTRNNNSAAEIYGQSQAKPACAKDALHCAQGQIVRTAIIFQAVIYPFLR